MTSYLNKSCIHLCAFALCCMLALPACKRNTPPVMRLQGPATFSSARGVAYQDPGIIAFDREDFDLSDQVTMVSTVDTHRVGTYQVTYTCTDLKGQSAQITRVVNVVHTIASLQGAYRSMSDFNICPMLGYASIYPEQGYPTQNLLDPAVGNGTTGSGNYLRFVMANDVPGYEVRILDGHIPCGYRMLGRGDISDDGDSVRFFCRATSDINASNTANVLLTYVKR
jgi:hypothetical protein